MQYGKKVCSFRSGNKGVWEAFRASSANRKRATEEHKEYCNKFFFGGDDSADCEHVTTIPTPEPVKEFRPIDKKWQAQKYVFATWCRINISYPGEE